MPTTPTNAPASQGKPLQLPTEVGSAQHAIAWSSLFFALLQSVCSFFAALAGLRLAIGVGSLALSAGAGATFDRIHADWIRVPMVGLAVLGSLMNLVVLLQIRHLRNRPAAQWRRVPLPPNKLRAERLQLALSIVTLAVIGFEEFFHLHYYGHL